MRHIGQYFQTTMFGFTVPYDGGSPNHICRAVEKLPNCLVVDKRISKIILLFCLGYYGDVDTLTAELIVQLFAIQTFDWSKKDGNSNECHLNHRNAFKMHFFNLLQLICFYPNYVFPLDACVAVCIYEFDLHLQIKICSPVVRYYTARVCRICELAYFILFVFETFFL